MRLLLRPTSVVFLLVFAAGLAWSAGTGQIWEDFYITYRASKNLAEGRGLTYTAGERVHSLTSPLGVLLPAVSYLLTGRSSDTAAWWIYRCMSLAALAGAAALLWRTLRMLVPGPAPAALLTALLATDSKTIGFAANGMETGLVLLFLAWSLWAIFTRPPRLARHLGLAWAGLMWSRPDSCVYIAAMGTGVLVFAPGEGKWLASRAAWCRRFLPAVALAAVGYAPWFFWAWSYYGSPVPHTVVAKGLFVDTSAGKILLEFIRFPFRVIEGTSTLKSTFLPYYDGWAGWSEWISLAAFAVAFAPLVLCLFPFIRWEARLASFGYAVGHFYFTAVVGPWPWYIPPVALLGLVAGSLTFGQVLATLDELPTASAHPGVTVLRRGFWTLAVALFLGSATMTLLMARQAYLETTVIARDVRGAIGLWLHHAAQSPQETVFLEPLGYIGFFSNLKMYDYPGLASPEVVAARRRAVSHDYGTSWPELIRDLQPDWLVLRPGEVRTIRRKDGRLLADAYERVKVFDASTEIARLKFVPIRPFLDYDGTFEIYHRKVSGPASVAGSGGGKRPS